MFNPNSDDLLKLQPIVEPPKDEAPEEMEEEPPPPLAQNEIFKQSQEKPTTSMEGDEIKWSKNIKMEVEEGVMNKKELNAWGKEKVRGVGKRGKDKKPRVKKPPSAKQLAHLARMREKAKQKRAAVALEKKRKKEEVKRIQRELEESKVKNTKIVKQAVMREPKVEKKVHYATNTPRQPSKEETFFALMEKYEKYKEAKNFKIRQEKTLQQRLNEKRRQQKPHPNRRIPELQRPIPPANPYTDIFNYKGRL
jgi:hypothetical protein